MEEYSKLYEKLINEPYQHPTKIEGIAKKLGIKYYALSKATDLLPEACVRFKPSNEILKSIREYFEKYSDVKLNYSKSKIKNKNLILS